MKEEIVEERPFYRSKVTYVDESHQYVYAHHFLTPTQLKKIPLSIPEGKDII